MHLPSPFRQAFWLLAFIGLLLLLYGVAESVIELILIGGVIFILFGAVSFFFGFPNDE